MKDSEIVRSIGERIKRARKAQSWLQNELAQELGMSKGHLSQVESGSGTLSLPLFARLCWALPTDPRYILQFPAEDEGSLQDRQYVVASLFSRDDMNWLIERTPKERREMVAAFRELVAAYEGPAKQTGA